jgi:acetylornithine deacetylase/succinyl-diaminopimelate desuccinylase-like protein
MFEMRSHAVAACPKVLAFLASLRAELEELVRIPSVSALADHVDDVRRSADVTARLLRDAGLEHVEVLEAEGMQPAVTGAWLHAGEDAPTVLLYAHHDVQPVGTPRDGTPNRSPPPSGTAASTAVEPRTTRPGS